jgi:hypothetical protein
MRSTRFVFASSLLALGAPAVLRPSHARAQGGKSLCIRVPAGMGSGFVTTSPSDEAGKYYIVVQNVVIPNPSQTIASFQLQDFSLIAKDGKVFHPSSRPGLGAIDISQKTMIIGPRQVLKGNLAFLVPTSVTYGNVEFRPSNWIINGTPVIFCCASNCRS